jgi:glutathione-regulated potassium-efflux system ancillary protein KefG
MARRILVVFAHPALEKSWLNRHLVEAAAETEAVSVRDLYELYPSFHIDVRAEQRALLEHDVILLQHPFYWYSCPALLKEWLDVTFEYGFAYGRGGTRLRGKWFGSVITTGGGEGAYQRDGYNRFPMEVLLTPFDQTAHLCGMHYLPPFIVHGAHQELTPERIRSEVGRYRAALRAVAADRMEPALWAGIKRMDDLSRCLVAAEAPEEAPHAR